MPKQSGVPDDLLLDRGLPISADSERLVLGGIMVNKASYPQVASIISAEDFGLEKHQRIFRRMADMFERGDHIDRMTLANDLIRYGELENIGGLSYLMDLDTNMPVIADISAYARIVKDKAVGRAIIFQAQHSMNRALVGEENPRDVVKDAVSRLIGIIPLDANSDPQTPKEIIDSHEGGINAFLQPHLQQKGMHTGFHKFDSMTGGLYQGELSIIGARPSQGKTALALNIAAKMALEDERLCLIFSLEMTKKALLERLVCALARVDSTRFRLGYTNQDERNKLQRATSRLVDAPIIIDDSSNVSLMDVISKIRSVEARRGKVELTVVDYLQLMRAIGKQENRNQEVTVISRGLKITAKELRVAMLLLSQLSRAPEKRGDPRPQLADLRDSGSIEADADLVGFVFRQEVYKPQREDLRGLAELIIAKQRRGAIGVVDLTFLHHLTKFENRAEDVPDQDGDWKTKQGPDDSTD